MIPSIERIENSGFVAWSPDETTTIAGWNVASNGGFTRRLNSATSIGQADTSMETREAIVDWLAERGAGLTIRVTPLVDDDVVAACIHEWDLVAYDATIVMVRTLPAEPSGENVTIVDPTNSRYTADLFELNHRPARVGAAWDRIVERSRTLSAGLWVPAKAVGFTAVSDRISSVFSVAVREQDRRSGLATAIMGSSAAWALEMGADSQFIQVLGTNAAAIELYDRLGFVERYRYSYLRPTGER